MKCSKNLLLFFLLSCFFTIFLVKLFMPVKADNSIDAKVQISVCGNLVVEGGEDCEGDNLNGGSCNSLGYASGNLTCDIACSFDATNCTGVLATPTPTLTPTSTPAPASGNSGTTLVDVPQPTSQPTVVPTVTFTEVLIPALPSVVALFDIDSSGRIETAEVFTAVKGWVEEWRENKPEKEKCDINQDKECSLIDLSILLYYVGK